jgi:diketogulonate reductase-like aldo/keto reductase
MKTNTFIVLVLLSQILSFISCAIPAVRLRNAAQPDVFMPAVGLGTGAYGSPDGTDGEYWNEAIAQNATTAWLNAGGTRIDTSYGYFTENGIGAALKASGKDRSSIFITTKVDPVGYDEVMNQFKIELQRLQTNYIDLLLVHWPGDNPQQNVTEAACKQGRPTYKECRQGSWKALESLFQNKVVRAIGVSNFEVNHLGDIFELGGLIPSVNQVEFHAYWHEDALLDFCTKNNITFNSYSPLGAPDHMAFNMDRWGLPLLTHPRVVSIAQNHGKTTGQVLLRWAIQQNIVVNPRTLNPKHMQDNLNIFNFELTWNDMATLSFLQHPQMYKVCGDPRTIP